MCRRIDPELQKQFIREVAEELRRWFRKWRRRITATGGLSLQRTALIFPRDTGHRVKDHIMIRNEVIDEEATQES